MLVPLYDSLKWLREACLLGTSQDHSKSNVSCDIKHIIHARERNNIQLNESLNGFTAIRVSRPNLLGETCARSSLQTSEHLHPWAERQALEMRFEGLQACTKFF